MPTFNAPSLGASSYADAHDNADEVDDASLDSFPASDPPGWGSFRIGPPNHERAVRTAGAEGTPTPETRPRGSA